MKTGDARQTAYFPTPRPELAEKLQEGDRIIDAAMTGSRRHIAAGRVLVAAEQAHETLYRLISGMMARTRQLTDGRRQIICIFSPGDLVAVKTLLFDRQPDSIEALTRATIAGLDYKRGEALATREPAVAFRLIWQLAEDERRLHKGVTMLGRASAEERIVSALVDLQLRCHPRAAAPVLLDLRQQDLADYVGLTPVHVNRTLKSLRAAGVIGKSSRGIVLADLPKLWELATPVLDIFERERLVPPAREHQTADYVAAVSA